MRRKAVLQLTLLLTLGAAFLTEHPGMLCNAASPATGQQGGVGTRPVFFAGGLSPDQVTALTANVAAAGEQGVVLLDSRANRRYLKAFLAAYKPSGVVFVGSFPEGTAALERALEVKAVDSVAWQEPFPAAVWKALFPQAERAVVCAAEPRGLFLHAAFLAGAMRAPLVVLKELPQEDLELGRRLELWKAREVYAAGALALRTCKGWQKGDVRSVPDEKTAAALALRLQRKRGPVQTLVLANPADNSSKGGGMSSLAPWVAVRHGGVLLLTNGKGSDAADVVRKAIEDPELRQVEHLTLVADLGAIPPERRPNPLPGKDETIDLEPLAPRNGEVFTFATGRLFDADPGVVMLMLARQRLLEEAPRQRNALIVSNPGGGLPLMETISRNTAKELENASYETRTFFNDEANKEDLRRLLPRQDIFLWEGHRSTLARDYQVPSWEDPLRPSLVFLQSCLALSETEAHPFLRRGAFAVVGSSSRTYSASGGAFALAYFDAMLYGDQSLGGSLRQAKNFLLAYTQLKEKRLGESATRNGAGIRAAWAFTLWGDPTLRLPRPKPVPGALAAVRTRVEGQRITLSLPETAYEEVRVEKYEAKMWPNSRLGGYLIKDADRDVWRLPSLLFAEVRLPQVPAGKPPRLRSKIPQSRWVFLWDERRAAGYLLVMPRPADKGDLLFEFGKRR